MNIFQLSLLINLILIILLFVIGMIKIRRKGNNPVGRREPTKNIFGVFSIISSTLLLLFLWIYYIIDIDISTYFFPVKIITDIIVIKWAAMIMMIGGTIIEICAAGSLGDSMRIHSPIEETELITKGIYGFIRNPVVLGMFLYSIGMLLFVPNLLGLFTAVFLIYGYNFKVDIEAQDLYRRFGDDWLEYCKNVGKYFPRLYKKQ